MLSGAQHLGRALLLCIALGAAPVARAEPIRLMMGGMSKIVYLPAVLASQLGYFKDEGLDVQVVSGPAGIDTSTELIAGAIEGAVGFYDHTLDLQSRGQDVLSVVVLQRAAGLAELASTRPEGGRELASAAAMNAARGKRLGVTGFGASTWMITRFLLARAGVAPGDYTVVPLASDTRFVEAFEQGTIDAGMVEEPTATRLLTSGAARVVVDMRTVEETQHWLGGPYAGACLYLRRSWMLEHRRETGQMVQALTRALRFIGTHSAEQIAAALPPEVVGNDRAGYVRALASAQGAFSQDGLMPDGAPQTVLKVLMTAGSGLTARHVDLSKTYTNEFVKGSE
ncbi:ABC transporter substrate-binding protein [Paraburkholderia silviterrae]|uniref:ABC transporter substrate-binding protein n=1 Tax=Paraburkholderia silviterrae TaxID=2528715 RepID=A0A4R5LZZ7_9BURK|nr:ABC transporter substrate-binding protein [Paraburkholderia silviterrae]TDG18395.1 ABC transporter substrate-binding protein [Paraburkholderia silviterrae]